MYHILVVDDEHPIREWLVHTIKINRADYAVDSAINGSDALEKLGHKPYQLVISDIKMPQMDGLGLFEQMQQTYPDIGIIVLSSYDDFNYVRTAFKLFAVDYLLKAEIDEERLLHSIDNFFREQFSKQNSNDVSKVLFNALGNKQASFDKLKFELDDLKIALPVNNYFCFLIKLNSEDLSNSHKIFQPAISDVRINFCIPISDNIYIGCLEFLFQPSKLLQLQTQSLFKSEFLKFNTVSLMIFSDIQVHSNLLLSVLRNVYNHRENDFYNKNFFLISSGSDQSEISLSNYYLKVFEAIKTKNAEQIQKELSEFFSFVEQTCFSNVSTVKSLCAKICESAYLFLNDNDPDSYHLYTKEYSVNIEVAPQITILEEVVTHSVFTLLESSNQKPTGVSNRIWNALKFIEENYMNQISLSSVAESVYLNPEYFSRSFKKEIGVNFNSYLNNLRLKKAMILIRDTDAKIYEVSMQTGFQNFAYFSKCFKAMYGISPLEWRSQHTKPLPKLALKSFGITK